MAIQRYVKKFVSDSQQVGGFLRLLSPIKLTATITLILLKVVLNTINPQTLFNANLIIHTIYKRLAEQ
jgi:hypothetical protein